MIELKKASVTMQVTRTETTIILECDTSGVRIAEIVLTPEQLSMALARFGNTPCKANVFENTDLLNKKMEVEKFAFPISENISKKDVNLLNGLAKAELHLTGKAEWTPDKQCESQDSFFKKDGVQYARVTIRRWVDVNDKSE